MYKENLQVYPLSLKKILENASVMPKSPNRFDQSNEVQKLTKEEKRELLELISKYNEYGKIFEAGEALQETTKIMEKMSKMAGTYVMNEQGDDFLHKNIVKRDFKSLDSQIKEFSKLSNECYGGLQQLHAIWENCGGLISRYFEVADINESVSTTSKETCPRCGKEECECSDLKMGCNLG